VICGKYPDETGDGLSVPGNGNSVLRV
jgi:hypothetical protein